MHGNRDVLARLQQATKSYGKVRALDGLDLSLRAGQVTSLLGANGAGKTTAIGLLLGLLRADSGSVELFGQDPRELAEWILADGLEVRLQIQLHKLLWGNAPGR